MQDMENWENIVKEEISKMIEHLKERGVESVKIDVSIKKLTPEQERNYRNFIEFENGNCTLEVDNIDDILKALPKKHKCTCCGKVSKDVKKIETGEYVCESCDQSLDVYRDKIRKMIKENGAGKINSMLDCIKHVTEFLEMNTEHDLSPEEETYDDFVNNVLLKYAVFESQEDMIDFLDDVIMYIEDNDIEP